MKHLKLFENNNYKIYCDMDSVLCDFTKMFTEITGMSMEEYAEKYGWKKAWTIIEEYETEFWSQLAWMPDGKKLWNYLKNLNVEILTATPFGMVGRYAKVGKDIWCYQNLGGDVIVNTVIGGENKYKFVKESTDILIDDMERNCRLWREHGGIAILHDNADTTIKELKDILKMKHLKEYKTFTTPEEERINDILDRGIENATQDEIEILKNRGEIKHQDKFIGIPDKMEFDLEKTEDFGDEIRATGVLTYNGEEYYGWFTLPKGDEQGRNTWDFFQGSMEFDPDPDDLYDLDSMIQEIEFEYLD